MATSSSCKPSDCESVDWEHRILEDSSSASWFGAALADDLAEVDALN